MKAKSKARTKSSEDVIDKPVLKLTDELYALDTRNYNFYESLSDDFKKQYSAFVLMRFMSSAPNQGGMHEFFLQMVNHFVNTDFWALSKYPDFQHLLLCLCGTGSKQYHKWIPNKKKTKEKWVELFKEENINLNNLEIDILHKELTSADILEKAIALGKSNKEAKEYAKSFEESK